MDRLAKRDDAEHIGPRVAALRVPIRLGGVEYHTSSSIGIACFLPMAILRDPDWQRGCGMYAPARGATTSNPMRRE